MRIFIPSVIEFVRVMRREFSDEWGVHFTR
jgi:hypothetical protein